MRLASDTKWADFFQFADTMAEGEAQRIGEAAAKARFGDGGFFDMTLGDFMRASGGDLTALWTDNGESVFDVYASEAFAAFIESLTDTLRKMTLQPTAEDKAMARGTLEMTFNEDIYYTCRGYFALRSFGEVDALRVYDYIMAKKDMYNQAVIQRNQLAKMKAK